MNPTVKKIISLLFSSIWLTISLIIWIAMLVFFIETSTFENWIIWGFGCTLVMIPTVLKVMFFSIKNGYIDGKHRYQGKVFYDYYGNMRIMFNDRRYSQAILSLIVSIFVLWLAGPLILVYKMVLSIINIIYRIRN